MGHNEEHRNESASGSMSSTSSPTTLSPTSHRTMPPPSVLLKLGTDPAEMERHELRKRCYSHSGVVSRGKAIPGGRPPTSPSPPARPFSLDSSIANSTKQLGRITKELHLVNEDLSHVVAAKRQMSYNTQASSGGGNVGGDGGSFSSDGGSDDDIGVEMFELCRSAQQDLKMADLAKQEVRTILNELETMLACEEKDMVSRAGWLRREGEYYFEKMSPTALMKLTSLSKPVDIIDGVKEEEDDDNDEENVSSVCKSL